MLVKNRTVLLVDDVPDTRRPFAWDPDRVMKSDRERFYTTQVEEKRAHPREWIPHFDILVARTLSLVSAIRKAQHGASPDAESIEQVQRCFKGRFNVQSHQAGRVVLVSPVLPTR
jgi:hypothetical protein